MSLRGDIESSVVTLLTSLAPLTIKKPPRPTNAQVSDDPEAIEALKRLILGALPGILVQAGSGSSESVSLTRKRHVQRINVDLVIGTSSLRSREEGARDDVAGNGPGMYEVLDKVRELLTGAQCTATGAGRFTPVREEPIVQAPGSCLWMSTFAVDVDVKKLPASGETALASVLGRIDFPVEEQIIAQGAGDSFTVAAGVVTLADAAALFLAAHVGMDITIAGSTTAANDGTYRITARPTAGSITWANAAGVAEAFTGTWIIHPAPPVETASSTT